MSMRKILLGVAAGAVGLGAMLFSRGKDQPQAPATKPQGWVRSTRLSQPIDHPLGLTVDGDYVYVVGGGFERAQNAVHRMPTAGGAVETLARVTKILSGELAVDAEHVYFSSDSDDAVLRVKKTGGEATAVAQATAAKFLALDATHVYFATYSKQDAGGTVQRVAKSGGAAEVLASGYAGMDGLGVDAQYVYFRSNKGLWKLPKSGGAAQNLVPVASKNVLRLVIDDTHLYFFLEQSVSGKYAVARVSKNGGDPQTLSTIVDSAGRLALSDTHVYFFRAASLRDNVLAKVAKNGGPTETVDGSGDNTGYLAVAQGNVYFTDGVTVLRAPK